MNDKTQPENLPAFPRPASRDEDGSFPSPQRGMTLRDYFAGQVMEQALRRASGEDWQEEAAFIAYEIADAMLQQREVGQ